jgi:outer membrane receptor protein involved in Fe transport
MKTNRSRLLASTLLVGAFTATTPALAQVGTPTNQTDTSANGEVPSAGSDIVITGSRIKRRDLETAAPITVVSQEEFRLQGSVNVETVLNQLPQVIPGATAFSNNPGGGVATLDLRGLGPTRTLVLVNNRRYMFYDASQLVDLNTIPSFLIEGVDTVTGGASAVYGSDAVAGVVNFRLRTDLSGVIAGAQYGITERGDGRRYNAYVAIGTELGGDNRGHATVFGEYYRRSSIFQGARDFSATDLTESRDANGNVTGTVVGGSSTTPNGRFTSTLAAANCPAGNVFCSPGAFYANAGTARRRVATDVYNFAPDNYLMVPQERYLLGGFADYEITKGVTAYTEVTFVNNRVATQLAPTPVTGNFNVNINAVSPFISAADIAALRQLDGVAATGQTVNDGVVQLAVSRRVNESGGRNSLDERNAFRWLFGVRGDLTEKFNYDLYYSYARTRNANIQEGNISRAAFQAGLNGTADAINIFGPNTLTPAMVNQVSILAQNGDISVLQVANGSVSGELFNLGMGAEAVGLSFGGEYRKLASRFIPDTALSSGDVIGFNAGLPTAGDYNVKEAFAELRVPIIADRPFFHSLEVSGAVRYSDYSLDAVGGVWTYAGSGQWSPVRDIMFRGQYQRAVRAPNVSELFGGRFTNFPQATDPCALATAANNATIRALCIATGVPAAAVGQTGTQINSQIQVQQGGNPDLQEETSDSYTGGVVLRPSFIPGLSITADYYNIKVKNTISVLGGGTGNSLNLCYNVIQNINSPYCQAFVGARNAQGQFDGVIQPQILNANVGTLRTNGIDVAVDYSHRLGFSVFGRDESRLAFNFNGNWTNDFTITPVAALPDITNECSGRFGTLACGNPYASFKWTSRVSYIDGPGTISFAWRHIGAVRDDDPDTNYLVERIPAYNLFNLAFSFDITDQYNFSFGVNNLLDKKPTLLAGNKEQSGTYPSTYDVLGRDFFASVRFNF